jgi:hypothetical protein
LTESTVSGQIDPYDPAKAHLLGMLSSWVLIVLINRDHRRVAARHACSVLPRVLVRNLQRKRAAPAQVFRLNPV